MVKDLLARSRRPEIWCSILPNVRFLVVWNIVGSLIGEDWARSTTGSLACLICPHFSTFAAYRDNPAPDFWSKQL